MANPIGLRRERQKLIRRKEAAAATDRCSEATPSSYRRDTYRPDLLAKAVAQAAVTNWQYLDTNAPAFNQRFYRAIGQGK